MVLYATIKKGGFFMISKKELGYISGWANKVPFPGNDYAEETMEKLKQAEKLFKEIYANNKYNITLSNNEEIELEIKEKNLAHILGIDFKNLSQDLFADFRKDILDISPEEYLNSYTLLQRIIENSDKVINYDKTSDYLKILNYYKVSVKSDIISKLGNLANFKFGCINFDKNEFLKNANVDHHNSNSTKYLYVPSEEPVSPYFLMGILPNRSYSQDEKIDETYDENEIVINNSPYIIETSIAPIDTKSYFQNQEVVIPTQILKDTNKELTKINATPSQKKALLKEYHSIITEYGINNRINIYSDYLSMLSEQEQVKKLIK